MNKDFIYQPKTKQQLRNWYNQKVKQNKADFLDFDDFYKWYCGQKKECHYCGLKELESQKIVTLGLLKSNRFPLNGKVTRGRARGVWLEIDRKEPKEKYSKNNCVLSCYFCNNDKSDVFNEKEYINFIKDRSGYLRNLGKMGEVEGEE